MSKLPLKIRMFLAKSGMQCKVLAEKIQVTPQTITDWQNPDKTPKRLRRRIADNLVSVSGGYITLQDCGY